MYMKVRVYLVPVALFITIIKKVSRCFELYKLARSAGLCTRSSARVDCKGKSKTLEKFFEKKFSKPFKKL
jgi:hypothetical protein